MGEGKATAGLSHQGLSGESTNLPSPLPPPALGHHGLGTSSHLASSLASVAQKDVRWLLGQPQAAKLQQCPHPAKGQPRVSKGKGGQRWVVRVGGVAKLPLPPVAGLPQLPVAGLAQPPRRAHLSPPLGPT